jgi:hypothetical protein
VPGGAALIFSAFGTKRTSIPTLNMSALGREADIRDLLVDLLVQVR